MSAALDRRMEDLEEEVEGQRVILVDLRLEVASLRTKLEGMDASNAARHAELKGLAEAMLAERQVGHKCIQSVAERLTDPRVLILVAVTGLVWAMAGTGLAVRVYDWVTVGPATEGP